MREIGESMGVNESRVSQIHKAALERMAENLQASGIHSAEAIRFSLPWALSPHDRQSASGWAPSVLQAVVPDFPELW